MKNKIAIVFGVICFALTIGMCIQIRSVDSITEKEGIKINDNSELIDEVFRLRQEYKDMYAILERTELKLEQVRAQATKHSDSDSYIESQIKNNNKLLGLTEVKGERSNN